VASEFRTPDAGEYRMDYAQPHGELEPAEAEIAVVDEALAALAAEGMLPHTRYDREKFLAHREAVREHFEIPWTAITPRMQRLLYAINAIVQPANMIAAGCFCGNTFISNAGAAAGPGACYEAQQLVGVEIKPDEAERAERNVRRIDRTGVARVVAADAVEFVADFDGTIDVLYLDAADPGELDKMPTGGLVLAHNSVNCATKLSTYLDFVRDDANFRASVNVILDGEGLEVSMK